MVEEMWTKCRCLTSETRQATCGRPARFSARFSGTIVGLGYVAEWTTSWVPFYHVFKTIFPLYLALPQTRGASYVYSVHLHSLIVKHEVEIDSALGRVKEKVWSLGPREAMADGAGTYGPVLTALLHAPSKPPSPPSPPSHLHPQSLPSTSSNHRTQPSYPYAQPPSQLQPHDSRARGTTSTTDMHPDAVLLARRRALEAELSALPLPNPHGEAPIPDPVARYPLVSHYTGRHATRGLVNVSPGAS
ncbi:hypothetical protein JB92DRAFT_3296314 [Gautieria morchelliformis]|nr:hypothetical protein JB92DRAFT_3296314 [Gautieria morchelliformis]